MYKNIIISFFVIFITKINTFAQWANVNCNWLPWCNSGWTPNGDSVMTASINIITLIIKLVSVFAVIALMISGIMYMISSWEEDKTKKAKSWIIWSLAWVVLSTSAYYIVGLIDNL